MKILENHLLDNGFNSDSFGYGIKITGKGAKISRIG